MVGLGVWTRKVFTRKRENKSSFCGTRRHAIHAYSGFPLWRRVFTSHITCQQVADSTPSEQLT